MRRATKRYVEGSVPLRDELPKPSSSGHAVSALACKQYRLEAYESNAAFSLAAAGVGD